MHLITHRSHADAEIIASGKILGRFCQMYAHIAVTVDDNGNEEVSKCVFICSPYVIFNTLTSSYV